MRTLTYVPVIHSSADLGSMAKAVAKRGVVHLGEEHWNRYRKTVEGFWVAMLYYFDSVNVSGLKIYQDGMMVEGEIGQKIVAEGVKAGSKNYEIVARLLQKGAVLVKTEDFKLVKEECDRLLAVIQAKSMPKKLFALIKYKLIKKRLLNKRDEFIAQRINETLKENEKGIIFIGAFHNIKKRLARDIQIKEIKDVRKMNEYQRLLPFYRKHRARFEELSDYLISEVKIKETDGNL